MAPLAQSHHGLSLNTANPHACASVMLSYLVPRVTRQSVARMKPRPTSSGGRVPVRGWNAGAGWLRNALVSIVPSGFRGTGGGGLQISKPGTAVAARRACATEG